LPRSRRPGAERNRNEFVVCDRIFEFLAEEPLLDQHIEARRKRAWTVLALEEADRARVLLAAKHELGLFSRCAMCFQTGMAAVIMTAMMLRPTISTTIA
jgi:hypothetical protein